RQRRLLAPSRGLAGIPLCRAVAARPLAFPVRIFGFVMGARAGRCQRQRRQQSCGLDHPSIEHGRACALATGSRSEHHRLAVAEVDMLGDPGAARRAAAQRRYSELELVARFEGRARPSLAHQGTRAHPFEAPGLEAAVLLLYREDDERVRRGELELLDRAFELDRVFLIEHGKGMMRQRATAAGKRAAEEQCTELPFHDRLRSDLPLRRPATRTRPTVVPQFEFSGTNSICLSAKSIGVTRPYA